MTDRDRCMAPCIVLRILLLCVLAAAEWPSVVVEKTPHVQRGLTTDIRATLSLSGYDLQHLTHCSIRQVPHSTHLSCGDLHPSSLSCDEPGPWIYRHYGCSSTSELLHLQLLAGRNSSKTGAKPEPYIQCITVEVAVKDAFVGSVRLQTTPRVSGGYEYTRLTPVFPPDWVGSCYYRIVRSLLPTADVHGMIGSALPCGYVPKEPFLLVGNSRHNRSILLEVTSTSPELPDTIHILLSADPPHGEEEPPPQFPSTALEILQFSNTPVPADLLSCPHPHHQCVYVFPVLEAGVFVPAYSPTRPLTAHTKFTSADVAAGTVAFIPNEEPLTSTFNYTITDFTGHVLGYSAVEVSILQRNWDVPSQRVDCGLQVAAGGQAFMDSRKLQFYIPHGSFCWQNTTMSLSQGPHKGRWVFVDGRTLEAQDTFPHTHLANRMLGYHHTSGGSDVVDSTVWQVSCGGDSFQVHFSILIAPSNEGLLGAQVPGARVEPSMLITFCGMASPLLLDVTNADPSLIVELGSLEGSVIRLARPNMLIGHPFPPYVAPPSLGPQEPVTSFSIQDMRQHLIWYIPTCSASHSLRLRLPGQASPAFLLQVLHSTVSIQDFFLLTVSAGFLEIVQNQPLPVNSHFPVYLTPYFLYVSSHVKQPNAVTYHIETPPQHGHICLVSALHCNSSLRQFTQNSLEEYKIVYKPDTSKELVNDSFNFHLGFRNVEMATPHLSIFQIYAAEPRHLLPPEDQFWVDVGGTKSVPLRHFRPFYYQLRKKNVTFYIISPPQHGKLIMVTQPDFHSQFTFANLNNRSLLYRHSGRGRQHCSDSFTFIASNSTHNRTSTVTIAIRQREHGLIGVEISNKRVLDQTNFALTSRDLRVISDFCSPFVQFTVRAIPTSGVLRLFQPVLQTFTQLGNGSVFTAEDVTAGRLWYSLNLFDSSTPNVSDTFLFNVSDPKQLNVTNDPRQNNGDNFQLTFQLMFLQPNEAPININATFNIHATYVLSWLPEHQTYGYIFQPDDIQVDSTPDLRANHINVKILIKRFPERGWIMMDSSKVTEFYLSDILEGRVRYEPIEWWMFKVSSDSFTMSVLFETNNTAVFTLYNHSMTLLWSWVHPPHTSYFVQESARELMLTLRRNLEYDVCPDYTSNLTLSFKSVTATVSDSCEGDWEGDVCTDILEVAFPPGNCTQNLTLQIAQDSILERKEYFLLDIVNCSNCVTDRKTINITISDQDDYAYVEVEAHSPAHSQQYCSRELIVQEGWGEVLLNLTRTGNMDHEVNVSCFTRPNTATPNEDFEPLSPNTTVTFAPNQTNALCVVIINDDALYEGKERFYVFLKPKAGLVETGQGLKPLCIYIVYDRNDAPILTFPPWPVIVQESEMRNVFASFPIFRSGENLEFNTTVCFTIVNNNLTTATFGLDYRLLDNYKCVTFGRDKTVVNVTLIVSPDNELEGEEYAFVELLPNISNGELGQPYRLNITIVDGTEPAYIGLSSTEFHVNESEGFVPFPVLRNGSIDGFTKIVCKLKIINTTTLTDPARADFIVPPKPETITFKPSNTTQNCHMLLSNDHVYEGVEALYLELDYSPLDPGVIIMRTRQRATIYIHDFEDRPKVWFSSSSYSVQEPLSNFDVDRRCATLNVTRGGDLSTNFTLSFITEAGSAQPDKDYISVNGTAHFDVGQDSLLINVPILANEEHIHLQWVDFSVHLISEPPVQVLDPQEVVVSIFNTPVTGVLFPARPVLASLAGNGTYLTGDTLLYDAPVVCVDPCDPDYQTITGVSYTEYCNHQQIDSNRTEYTWNLSSDGLNYQQVRQPTTFTSYEGKVLEPLYLESGVYVSCSAQAVTTSGTQGNTRASTKVRLSRSMLPRDRCEDSTPLFQLYKYDGFTGNPEELLKLSITLPHRNNHIPLISTRPFQPFDNHLFLSLLTRPRDRDKHSCSNLVDSGPQKTSFLTPLPTSSSSSSVLYSPLSLRAPRSRLVYQHFSSSECHWHFELWLPLAILTNSTHCNAQLSQDGQVWTLILPLYYAYVHIRPSGAILVHPPVSSANVARSSYSSMVRATWSSGQELSVPFNTFPSTGGSTYIYPIMTQYRGSLTVIFYSVTEAGDEIDHVEVTGSLGNTTIPRPLYSSSSPSSSVIHQAWQLEIPGKVESLVILDLWPLCSGGRCRSLSFLWYISAADNFEPSIAPQMDGVLEYNISDKTTANSGLVTGAVWLETYFQLRSDYAINLETATLYLCTDTTNDTACTGYSRIWIMIHHDKKAVIAAGFDMQIAVVSPSSINFTFKAEPLHKLDETGPFELEIKCSIQHLSGSQLTKSPVHSLTLPLLFASPEEPGPTPAASGGISKHMALLASAIAIFVTAVVLVAIVMTTVALLWRWQARRRSSPTVQVKATEEEVRNCERPRRLPRRLKKSASTTSFPTMEKTKKQNKATPEGLHVASQITGQIDHGAFLSKSLPNLSLTFRKEGLPESRKRQLRKSNVRVKFINTHQANLNMWQDEGKAEEKEVGVRVIKNILHLAPVARVQPRTGELANYAMRSIAASAITPEPGSVPATEL